MKTENAQTKNWYDNKIVLILLFFILPPIGIYGMVKHKTDSWKKILYIIPSAFLTLIIIVAIISSVFIDYYKNGIDYYNKKEYLNAYESLSLVSSTNKNYSDAVMKMNEIKPFVDSLKQVAEKDKLALEQQKNVEKEAKKASKEKENQDKETMKELANNPILSLPKTEQDFIQVLNQTEKEYDDQPNELKKSSVKTKRGDLIKNALGNTRNFTEWIGVVKDMQTTSKGKAIFNVEIEGTGISIMTMNNEFSDLMDNTLIDQKNPLYNIIADLKIGDKVRVSGNFIQSPENDYVYELSITESGSMKNPDFIVHFTKIIKQ